MACVLVVNNGQRLSMIAEWRVRKSNTIIAAQQDEGIFDDYLRWFQCDKHGNRKA
jgi:hypothetical protein